MLDDPFSIKLRWPYSTKEESGVDDDEYYLNNFL